MLQSSSRGRWAALATLATVCLAGPLAAQRPRAGQEFTRQGLLVANLAPGPGADTALGDRVAALLRDRLDRLLDDREVDVVSTGRMHGRPQRAGFDGRGVVDAGRLEQLGRSFRAFLSQLELFAERQLGSRCAAFVASSEASPAAAAATSGTPPHPSPAP